MKERKTNFKNEDSTVGALLFDANKKCIIPAQ